MEPVSNPAVLVIDDEPSSVNLLRITLGLEFNVFTATDGETALATLAQHPEIGVTVIDQRMPGMTGAEFIRHTAVPYPDLVRIILTGYTDFDSLVEAINGGQVFRYLTKPWHKDELLATVRQGAAMYRLTRENLRLEEELRQANERLRVENAQLRREVLGRHRFGGIVGSSPALAATLRLAERVAATGSTVLLLGETGAGKELIARAIHYNSARAEKPFISENCGAIAPDLLTGELFGHKRGSFTDAREDRQGLFEVADGGTLFLDEVGDCSPDLQTRLLRVLDQGEIRRVGDSETRRVDVRVIAATNHDLESDVVQGKFRKDLFYRLSVVTITLPPLRERKEDIPLLAQHFVERFNAEGAKQVAGLTPGSVRALSSYDFPGNVRELENEIERAFALADPGGYITPDLFSSRLRGDADAIIVGDGTLRAAVERYEAQLLREALTRNGGNQTRTAAELGLSRRGLIDKLQKYGIR